MRLAINLPPRYAEHVATLTQAAQQLDAAGFESLEISVERPDGFDSIVLTFCLEGREWTFRNLLDFDHFPSHVSGAVIIMRMEAERSTP